MTLPPPLPEGLLASYGLEGAVVEPLGDGLINHTWRVQAGAGEPRVLQRVNSIFPPAVNDDIAVVTRHLAARGLSTPTLLPTTDGSPVSYTHLTLPTTDVVCRSRWWRYH